KSPPRYVGKIIVSRGRGEGQDADGIDPSEAVDGIQKESRRDPSGPIRRRLGCEAGLDEAGAWVFWQKPRGPREGTGSDSIYPLKRFNKLAVIRCTRESGPFGLAPWAEGCK